MRVLFRVYPSLRSKSKFLSEKWEIPLHSYSFRLLISVLECSSKRMQVALSKVARDSFCVVLNRRSGHVARNKLYWDANDVVRLLPGKGVYFYLSIFIKYFDFVCLRYHYNQLQEANFSLPILETRSSFLVQLLRKWLWRVRIIKTFVFLHREPW